MKFKKLFLLVLISVFAVSTGMMLSKIGSNTFTKQAKTAAENYEIYPTPRKIVYDNGSYDLKQEINLIFSNSIDEFTKNKAKEVLGTKGTTSVGTGHNQEVTNVYVLTNLDDDSNTQAMKTKYSTDLASVTFEKIDEFFLKSDNNNIVILGRHTNAAYYGVVTLKHILSQIDRTIKNFTIADYADTPIRGFIEGYYGNPWSHEDRMSLMKFGGEFKMTSYIFAPKDDPYHKEKWREKYPEKELAQMAELAKVGNESKTRFVWTAHPFMGKFNAADKDNEINRLIAKFEQLYSVGVRQFGVLGDDVGQLDRQIVIDMLTKVSKWADEKTKANPLDPVYDTVYCPTGYNHSWQISQTNYGELNDLDSKFPKNVQIFWTGEAVCQPVQQVTLDHFRSHNLPQDYQSAGKKRRSPLFWLNWPVNDVNHSRMVMGRGEQLKKDVKPEDLAGVVTNPMQEAEASKVAIFAVADYSWNIQGFNMDKSWNDSFKYIDENASKELHTIAKHMSDPAPNGHGLVQSESEDLKQYLDAFKDAYTRGDKVATREARERLLTEFNIIIEDINNFHKKSTNKNLKDELLPYTESLKEKLQAAISYLNAVDALLVANSESAINNYLEGNDLLALSKDHTKLVLKTVHVVEPAAKRIVPFINWLRNAVAEPINKFIGANANSKVEISVDAHFANGTSPYGGNHLNKAVDGNADSYFWNGAMSRVGDYVELRLSKPSTVYGANILLGTEGEGAKADLFTTAVVKVFTTDNLEGEVVGTYENYQKRINSAFVRTNVTAIRYEAKEMTENKWFIMREFSVKLTPSGQKFGASVFKSEAFNKMYENTKDSSIVDDNLNSYVWYNNRQGDPNNGDHVLPNDYIGIKFSQVEHVGKISLYLGKQNGHNDHFHNFILEYSSTSETDGYKTIKEYKGLKNGPILNIDLTEEGGIHAKYIRMRATQREQTWVAIRNFSAESYIPYPEKAYTNTTTLKDLGTIIFPNYAKVQPKDNITLKPNEFIGIDLKDITGIKEILVSESTNNPNLKAQVSSSGYEWKELQEGTISRSRYVILRNTGTTDATFNLSNFRINFFYYPDIKVIKNDFGGLDGSIMNLFDQDRTTKTQFTGDQNKGREFIIDLGRVIDLRKIKIVLHDGEWDFPRHAKLFGSENNEQYNELMVMGNQDKENPNESATQDDIKFVFPDHETSYYTKTADNLNLKVRYLKFQITRTKTGDKKWVRFSEFEINDDYNFEPFEPRIESTSKSKAKTNLQNAIDGNIATFFAPKDNAGSLTYYVNENASTAQVLKVVQAGGKNTSNALVKISYATKDNPTAAKELVLGKLDHSLNEFKLPKNIILFSVKIDWEKPMQLYEIVVSDTEDKFESVQTMSSLRVSYDLDTKTPNKVDLRFGGLFEESLYNEHTEYGVIVLPKSMMSQLEFVTLEKLAEFKQQGYAQVAKNIAKVNAQGQADENGGFRQFAWVITNMEGHYSDELVAVMYSLNGAKLITSKPTTESVMSVKDKTIAKLTEGLAEHPEYQDIIDVLKKIA